MRAAALLALATQLALVADGRGFLNSAVRLCCVGRHINIAVPPASIPPYSIYDATDQTCAAARSSGEVVPARQYGTHSSAPACSQVHRLHQRIHG